MVKAYVGWENADENWQKDKGDREYLKTLLKAHDLARSRTLSELIFCPCISLKWFGFFWNLLCKIVEIDDLTIMTQRIFANENILRLIS